MRLDQYVAQFWPEHSRSVWQNYIAAGYVTVNGEVQVSTKLRLDEDDEVAVTIPESINFSDNVLPVIYEDKCVVVINKPAGILTHAKGALTDEFSVAEFMRPKMSEPDTSNRPGIVHRLDRDTSGVIICAKDAETNGKLQKQFQARTAHKSYIAVVAGVPKEPRALIDLPIERNPKEPSRHRVGTNGKPSQTEYEVVASNKKYSVVRLRPKTGRTHQLRIHMAYIGTPIVGDRMYGTGKSPIDRLCLHAETLEITIPQSQRKTFTAPPPDDFLALIKSIDD